MINARCVARESKADRSRRFQQIVRRLEKAMPEAKIALEYQDELQLLVSVMLSAQCTDAVVNQVTPALFARAADARLSELEAEGTVEKVAGQLQEKVGEVKKVFGK